MAILHHVKQADALAPAYVSKFKCTGPACPDNCCTGWGVSIDRKTHMAYQQTSHEQLSSRFKSAIRRTRTGNQQSNYSMIELKPVSAECPFMEEKICSIQRELGEDKLSDTCHSYPRNTKEVGEVRQQAMTLSCPEAARLALTEESAMDFEVVPIRARQAQIHVSGRAQGLSLESMNAIRFACLRMMRTQTAPVWERLAALGVLCEQLTAELETGHHDAALKAAGEVEAMLSGGHTAQALQAMHADHTAQALTFSRLWVNRSTTAASEVERRVCAEIAQGLGVQADLEVRVADLISRYTHGVALLKKSLEDVPFLVEHYIVNEMFREVFPFGDVNPLVHYRRLVVRYGVVRLMMSARCAAKERSLSPAELAETVQVFARLHQHNPVFAQRSEAALQAAKWDSLDRIFRFLRD